MGRYIHTDEVENYEFCREKGARSSGRYPQHDLDFASAEQDLAHWIDVQDKILNPPVMPRWKAREFIGVSIVGGILLLLFLPLFFELEDIVSCFLLPYPILMVIRYVQYGKQKVEIYQCKQFAVQYVNKLVQGDLLLVHPSQKIYDDSIKIELEHSYDITTRCTVVLDCSTEYLPYYIHRLYKYHLLRLFSQMWIAAKYLPYCSIEGKILYSNDPAEYVRYRLDPTTRETLRKTPYVMMELVELIRKIQKAVLLRLFSKRQIVAKYLPHFSIDGKRTYSNQPTDIQHHRNRIPYETSSRTRSALKELEELLQQIQSNAVTSRGGITSDAGRCIKCEFTKECAYTNEEVVKYIEQGA